MAIEEATSGELQDDPQFQEQFRNLMRKNARRLAEKKTLEGEASRLQLEREEKQRATTTEEVSLGGSTENARRGAT